MNEWRRRFPRHLLDAAPYSAAWSEASGGPGGPAGSGVSDGPDAFDATRDAAAILLDANESSGGPVGWKGEVDPRTPAPHRYPDPRYALLRSGLASYVGVPAERLWIGSGADDAIDVLIRSLVQPRELIVTVEPTYTLYGQRAAVHGCAVRAVPLDGEFDIDVEAVVEASRDAPLLILCSPNNPTGRALSVERVLEVVARTSAVVAIDEAYVEFSERRSLAELAGSATHPTLAVIRTFSKAWGLAALRTGYLAGAEPLVRMMEIVGLPYRLTGPAIRRASDALHAEEEMRRRCAAVRKERSRVRDGLEALGLRVLPSDANFLLFFVGDPQRVHEALLRRGIRIRRRDGLPGLSGALRVTIGDRTANDAFLAALRETLP